MAETNPYPSERLPNINRRNLLSTAVGMTAAGIVPNVKSSEVVLVDATQSSTTNADLFPLNPGANTSRRLLEIERRNELRAETKLPLLPIAKELRRMKETEDSQKFAEAFGPFAAKHRQAAWNHVLKTRREIEGSNWRPNWIAGMGYQGEVHRILRERFRADKQVIGSNFRSIRAVA